MNQNLNELRSFLASLDKAPEPMHISSELHALSSASDADIDIVLDRALYPFQRAGVAYALRQRRCIIGDEMGLGKTIQGIAVVAQAHKEGMKSLIVVPPSLRLNWQREFKATAPWLSVAIVTGNTVTEVPKADVIIIGDSNVDQWAVALCNARFGCVIVDEAHRAKNAKANRTKGIVNIAKSVNDKGYVILLSGTIVVNRPAELVSPLTIIGRLDRVFGGRHSFLQRYCDPIHNGWGWVYNGASNTTELNANMRGTCYVRRKKMDVLTELPAKRRAQVSVEVPEEALIKYRHAEEDFRDFVITNGGAEAWNKASKAEVITRINALRHLLGFAKVANVVEHVENLLAEDEQVIVFAYHTDVINAICKALASHNVVKVGGGMTDEAKQNAVDSFQSGEAKVFVGQFQAAGVGLTLTASSNVVMAEIPWTPADAVQAEDRSHRIGNTVGTMAWWLTVADEERPTIDDRMWALLNAKHTTVSAVLDGYGVDLGAEGGILADLIDGIIGN